MYKKIKENGVSLKAVSGIVFVISIIIMVALLVTSFIAFASFRDLGEATDDYIILQGAANDLMHASDLLTEETQCYVVTGQRQHLDNYLKEAEVDCNREKAIALMEERLPESEALTELKECMKHSVELMEREYYAMRLVLDAQGETDIPEALKNVVISDEDMALSNEAKKALAQNLVHDEGYHAKKNEIISNMQDCLDSLRTSTDESQTRTAKRANISLQAIAVLIIIQSVAVCFILWAFNILGVNPLISAVRHIDTDKSIPVTGASEFRYLAHAYNGMFNKYKSHLDELNFKASHDNLTGVYNRAGYDLIKKRVELNTTAMIMFDADGFKAINDNFGHETGDLVLKKIAKTLKNKFRSDDYVCRIGGDEFIVFMVHVPEINKTLIEGKIRQINQLLSDDSDGVPAVSLSAGITANYSGDDIQEMVRQADRALYKVKANGRNGCCFYSDMND